jgi:alcohol dehydrogenase (cytochrome c)
VRLAGGAPAGGPPAAGAAPVVVGGEGSGDVVVGGNISIKGSILAVNGVLYVTAPDNIWALDAHDGHTLWRYFWKTKGGTHIGNRGAAMWNNYLFFVTPDDYFMSLDARTGKERWHKEIASFAQQHFLTSAPMVVGNHVMVGYRQRSRFSRFPAVVRSGIRRAAMEVLHRANEPRRSRS